MTRTLKTIIQHSGVKFGTSGARGLVSDFSEEVCGAFTVSFLQAMQQHFNFERVAVGMDNRPSSPDIAAAICGAAEAMGVDVVFYGVIPTPALAYQAMQDNEPSIMVTGSHIPFDRNGIKFYRPNGEITKDDELSILNCSSDMVGFNSKVYEVSAAASHSYSQRYASFFGDKALSGLKIGIYEHSSAGRDLYSSLFEEMGAEVTSLGRSDEFVPIDTEAVSTEDQEKAKSWSAEYGFDAIFSTDGDGDRPLISDEKGAWLRGDVVGLLTSKILKIESLAVPVSCNTAIEKSNLFQEVLRTKIGSPYVIEAFEELADKYSSFAGFEANGGFLLGSDIESVIEKLFALPTRDALLPVIVLLSEVVSCGSPLSEHVAQLPNRYTASDRIQGVPTEVSNALINEGGVNPQSLLDKLGFLEETVIDVNQVDGLRLTLNGGLIVHLRPSGNAPELRCYAEADNQSKAEKLVKKVLSTVADLI